MLRAWRALMPKPGGGSVCEGGATDCGTSESGLRMRGGGQRREQREGQRSDQQQRRRALVQDGGGILSSYRPLRQAA